MSSAPGRPAAQYLPPKPPLSSAGSGRPLPNLIQPTGLGEDYPIDRLLELAVSSFNSGRSNDILAGEDWKGGIILSRNEPVRNREKLFPKTPIVNITSAKQALSDTVSDILY